MHTRHRYKLVTEAGKLHKRKIETNEYKGTCNGPVYFVQKLRLQHASRHVHPLQLQYGLQSTTTFAFNDYQWRKMIYKMSELCITQTRYRYKMPTEAGKLRKRKIETDESNGTCNGSIFLCNNYTSSRLAGTYILCSDSTVFDDFQWRKIIREISELCVL